MAKQHFMLLSPALANWRNAPLCHCGSTDSIFLCRCGFWM